MDWKKMFRSRPQKERDEAEDAARARGASQQEVEAAGKEAYDEYRRRSAGASAGAGV